MKEYIKTFAQCIFNCGFNLKEAHEMGMLFYGWKA